MTIGALVRELKGYPQDVEIEIECPNGMLVDPKIKFIHEDSMNPCSKVLGYVLTGRP
jgi:hypothetical protein